MNKMQMLPIDGSVTKGLRKQSNKIINIGNTQLFVKQWVWQKGNQMKTKSTIPILVQPWACEPKATITKTNYTQKDI